jgi:hypothetical protein
MDDLILNFLVIAGALTLVGCIFFFANQIQKKDKQNLTKFAHQKGWKIEHRRRPLESGFRITAREWQLESISRSEGFETGPGSTNWEQKTTWFTSRPGSTILIGPRTSQLNINQHAEKLVNQILKAALGKDADGLKEIHMGNSTFQEHFMVWAQDAEKLGSFLTPSLQYALLNWTKRPLVIKRTSKGITIELKGEKLKTPGELTELIKLGEQLL